MKVKEILQEQGIKPTKRFGQSFLTDEKIAELIIRVSEIDQEDIILEVGAGLGILTQYLCVGAKKVFAVEKDPILFRYLTQKFQDTKNLILLNRDILFLELSTLIQGSEAIQSSKAIQSSEAIRSSEAIQSSEATSQLSTKLKIVSNLPYSITNDFLYWLLSNRVFFKLCVLTLQKEVVQRIYARPGSKIYGVLSVLYQFYMELELHFLISGNSFFPRTPIVSQVISILPRNKIVGQDFSLAYEEIDESLFFKIVKTSFRERRKQLKNSLGLKIDTLGGIDLSRRPESLSFEEFLKLTHSLAHYSLL